MPKRSLALLSALVLAICVPSLSASDAGSKDAAKNKKAARTTTKKHKNTTSTKKHKGTSAMTPPSSPTGSYQTTITPGSSPAGAQTTYDPKKGRRHAAAPKKKKP